MSILSATSFSKKKPLLPCFPDYDLILLNKDGLATAKLEEVIFTAHHETRHVYQKAQMEGIPGLNNMESPNVIAR